MIDQVSTDDVARFVSEYMSGNERALRATPDGRSGNLLDQIAEAYLAYRGLPRSAFVEVVAMVDSVL